MSELRPKGVAFKDGAYYWVHRNRWLHLGREVASARKRYNALRREHGRPPNWPEPALYRAILKKAEHNARRRSLAFDLTEADLADMVTASRHRCALTRIQFDVDYRPGCSRRPFAPSLDRIESAKGYVRGNVRLVCFAVNVALADWGEPIMRRVAQAYLKASKGPRKALETSA